MFVYEISAIDNGWERLKSVQETLIDLFESTGWENEISEFAKSWNKAKRLAKRQGWEGDFNGDPVVFWIPGREIDMLYGFVFKQPTNGSTYVISPVRMSWLEIE